MIRILPNHLRIAAAACGLLALFAIFPGATAQAQLSDGLIAYWPFEENLNDISGSDTTYNGLEQGGDAIGYVDAKFGKGILLDGIDQFVEVENSEEDMNFIDQSFSLSCWFKVNELNKSWQALVAKGEGQRWRIHRRGGESIMTFNGGNGDVPAGPTSVDDGEYHHLVAVRDLDNDEARLYINGELESSNSGLNPEENFNPMMIGENPDAGGRTWDGEIDDMALWTRVLSDDEISEIFNSGTGSEIGFLLDPEDSDEDGMPDKYEEENGLDPEVNDADGDKDGDTLTNLEEFENGTLAGKADSDDDGLNDNVETKTGTWVSATDTGTNPRSPDTDRDGLKDGVETNTGTFVDANDTGTDPHKKDTDGGGASDGTEVALGSNPLDENDEGDVLKANAEWDIVHIFNGGTISDAAGAQDAIDNEDGEVFKGKSKWVHFHDNVEPPVFVDDSLPYPGFDDFGDNNDFAIQAKGSICAAASGTYTFVCNSDDGFVLIIDDEIVGEAGNRGRGNTFMDVDLSEGVHEVCFIHWERGGGAGVSLLHARQLGGGATNLNEDDWVLTRPFVDTSDTDGDGITDLYETANDLDPNVNDAEEDKDEDGLTNLAEFQMGTRANKKDTDEDGLDDNVETGTGTYVDANNTGTDPLKPDTDRDELPDGVETATGAFVSATDTGTDPNKEDTDGDGKSDGNEVAKGTDPHDPNSPPPPRNESLVGYWPFDDSLFDLSGNGSDGELQDGDDDVPDFVEGKVGGALSLDGISEHVVIEPDNEPLYDGFNEDGEQTGFTVAAWFKVEAFEKSWQALVAKGEGNRWRVHRRGGESTITGNGGNADVSAGSIAVDDGEWHHFALVSVPDTLSDEEAEALGYEEDATVVGGGVVLFVDNEFEGSSGPPTLEDNDQPMRVGENPDARNRTWNGLIDDLGFWSRPISREEIALLYNGGDGASIQSLPQPLGLGGGGGPGFQITEVVRDANNVTITWPSRDGQSFIVEQSTTEDSFTWEELTDGHPSGGETTSFELAIPDPAPDVLYLRVRRE